MMTRSLTTTLLVLGLAMPGSAWALSCDDIMGMLAANVPSSVAVTTIQSSGQKFTSADVSCLTSRGAPADVVAAVKGMAAPVAAPLPTTPASPDPVVPSSGPVTARPAPTALPDDNETLTGTTADLEEPGGGGPAEVEELVGAYRAGKFLTSSKGLYDLIVADKYPDQSTRMHYYLAKSLNDLGMVQSGQYYFMEVVRKGPSNPYFKYALPWLVKISQQTGNDYELLRVVKQISPEAFPREARNHIVYLLGRKNFEEENLAEASEFFQQVSPKSELYMRARFYDGVISSERQKYRSAVQAFNDVVEARPAVATLEEAAQLEDMRDLAVMNIARIYYELQRYETSEVNYRMVQRDSIYWAQSLFERAWATFVQQDLNRTLGLLLTVESPYFSQSEYLPEVTLLRALTYFNLCEYGEVERILIDFDKRYAPQKAELEVFLDQYKSEEGRKLSDQAFEAYFQNKAADSTLETAMFAKILRNRELSAHVRSIDAMDAEVGLIDAQKALWKDTIGDGLKQILEGDRLRYKKQAGRVFLQEMLEQYRSLADLLIQSEIVRFEVVDAQRQDYEFKMQNPDVAAGEEDLVDYTTDPKRVYWPFNGEFWRDELGFYKYAEHGACK